MALKIEIQHKICVLLKQYCLKSNFKLFQVADYLTYLSDFSIIRLLSQINLGFCLT